MTGRPVLAWRSAALNQALKDCAREMIYLAGPSAPSKHVTGISRPTRWLPCEDCDAVEAIAHGQTWWPVSLVCASCLSKQAWDNEE